MGVVIDEGDHRVLLAGDTSYTEDLLLRGVIDGVGPDEQGERIAHQRVRAYAATHPTVYLVAHDPGTGVRLAERRVLGPAAVEAEA